MLVIVGQPYRCRRPLGTANHNPITGPFQIGESESSANTGATYDDEISSFFPSFPLRTKRIMLWHSWHVKCTLKKKKEFWKNSVEKEAKQPQDQGTVELTVTVGAPRLLTLIARRTFCSQQSFVVEGIMKDFCFLFLGPHSSPLSSNTYIHVAFASFPKSHCRFATFCCCHCC